MTTLGRVMAGGYKLVPGATGPSGAVTYKVQNAGTGLAVNGCRKRPLSAFEKAAGGLVLYGCSTVWFVPRATLAGVVPKPGDSIAADGALWIVEHVESALQESDYKLFGAENR